MSKPRILIAEADAKQLRDFASIVLGLEIVGRETCHMMMSRISEAGYSSDSIPDMSVPDTPTAPFSMAEGNPSYRIGGDGTPEHRILIPESDRPGGSDPVQVGLNGRVILIGRGVPSWVSEPYVEILKNAEEFVYEEFKGQRSENGIDLGGLSKPRKVMSYPYQTV